MKWKVDKGASWQNDLEPFEKVASWQNVKLTKCQVDKMSSWQNVKLTKCHFDKMSSWQNVKLTKCQVDKMSSRQNVKLTKRHVDQMMSHHKKQTGSDHFYLLQETEVQKKSLSSPATRITRFGPENRSRILRTGSTTTAAPWEASGGKPAKLYVFVDAPAK